MSAEKEFKPKQDETLDTIKDIRLLQSKNGYRFSVDAVLLENFISAKRLNKGIELGTGSGVISILLARRIKGVKLYAVEIQEALAERAEQNVKLNGLGKKISVLNMDMKMLKNEFRTNEFDFVFSNPPYRKPRTGRMSIFEEKAVARHEIEITLHDLIKTASYLLKHSGKFFLIYHPFRLAELVGLLQKAGLEPKRMRFVHSCMGEEAKMVMIEAVKGAGTWLKVDPPLYLYDRKDEYSREMRDIFDK